MAILNKIYPLALAALLASCAEEFDPNVDSKPVLCMNSLITAGETIRVDLTHTWRYNISDGGIRNNVTDAALSIYANDVPVDKDYVAREGDHIRLVAVSPTYGSAEAEVTVPSAPSVKSITYKAVPTSIIVQSTPEMRMDSEIIFNLTALLEVEDNRPDENNYYNLDFKTFYNYDYGDWTNDTGAYLYGSNFEYESEPIFTEHIDEIDLITGADGFGVSFFTDRQFRGKSYTLNLRFTNMNYGVKYEEIVHALYDCGLQFDLWSTSESFYKWELYSWQADEGILWDLGDIGFGDPKWAYSNVSSSAGVVAARTKTTCRLNISDFIQKCVGL